ncbi:MAG: hypothetical protein MJZ81_02385 [Bacteroidales bacterium]|nr:hypothetical protein [Bacteroidales bacterium]
MKGKGIIMGVLALAIVGLVVAIYSSVMKPVRFEQDFYTRRDACALKLKTIRVLEEQYKLTYGKYCGDFDTLVNRLLTEDSLHIRQKQINYDVIPEDVSVNDMLESEAIKRGYIKYEEVYVNPIAQLREQKKLDYTDANGAVKTFTDQELKNLCYIPYPKGTTEKFQLEAGTIVNNGFNVPVFECKIDLKTLMSDLDDQLVRNKIAEIERVSSKYAGWKVGDMTQAITDGNFE